MFSIFRLFLLIYSQWHLNLRSTYRLRHDLMPRYLLLFGLCWCQICCTFIEWVAAASHQPVDHRFSFMFANCSRIVPVYSNSRTQRDILLLYASCSASSSSTSLFCWSTTTVFYWANTFIVIIGCCCCFCSASSSSSFYYFIHLFVLLSWWSTSASKTNSFPLLLSTTRIQRRRRRRRRSIRFKTTKTTTLKVLYDLYCRIYCYCWFS